MQVKTNNNQQQSKKKMKKMSIRLRNKMSNVKTKEMIQTAL